MELTKVVTIARSRGMENVSLFVVIWILAQLEMHETGLFPSSMERTTGDYWDGEAVIAPLSDEETTGTLGSGYLLDNASAVASCCQNRREGTYLGRVDVKWKTSAWRSFAHGHQRYRPPSLGSKGTQEPRMEAIKGK
ncbi:unnamed protein product [Clonostachys chloroleuca]|uniref:Uncharacterized protein n=1 Tax=Clonostachys chloroleuca TaxID=1926264 RepID=A0AA35M9X2_9HYPO|nr:unnamed protein product [Clonostachys chloroleuca]